MYWVVWRVSVALELATGLLLLVAPVVVIQALIGPTAAAATVLGRVLGGALLALGVAGGGSRGHHPDGGIRFAYVLYDFATATILASAGLAGTAGGALLWPVVIVHSALGTVLLVSSMRRG